MVSGLGLEVFPNSKHQYGSSFDLGAEYRLVSSSSLDAESSFWDVRHRLWSLGVASKPFFVEYVV